METNNTITEEEMLDNSFPLDDSKNFTPPGREDESLNYKLWDYLKRMDEIPMNENYTGYEIKQFAVNDFTEGAAWRKVNI